MDAEDARWLVGADAAAELARLADEPDPSSLAAGERLRRRLPPGRAAAVSSQVALRRRAVAKFGDRAARLFFTPDGLEQASRPEVARWRADRFAAAGVRRVVDLGCGIGTDALALVERGVPVDAVERDPVTAVLAAANLGDRGRVHAGTAEELWPALAGDGAGVFCDPARRTSSGRSWRVEDLSPSWEFVRELLAGDAPAAVKLGPGLAHRLIPDGVAATWVSHRGDLVELSLWSGAWAAGRQAVLLPGGHVLAAGDAAAVPAAGPVGRFVHEPDPAVVRAGAVGALARLLDARPVGDGIAYLTSAEARPTPFATSFEVLDVLDAGEKALRSWIRRERIGTLEIKKRGVDVDPAALRRRLKPSGTGSATLMLTPTPDGARALVVRRLPRAD